VFEAHSEGDDVNFLLNDIFGLKVENQNITRKNSSSSTKIPLPTVTLILERLKEAGMPLGNIECHEFISLSELEKSQSAFNRSFDVHVWLLGYAAVSNQPYIIIIITINI